RRRPGSPLPRGGVPRADHPPAVRWTAALLDLLDLAAARERLTGVPGTQEDREPGHGVTQEGGRDPTGHGGQPAADEPDPDRRRQEVSVALGGAQPRREGV